MSDEAAFIWCLFITLWLFVGDPDLVDALIDLVGRLAR